MSNKVEYIYAPYITITPDYIVMMTKHESQLDFKCNVCSRGFKKKINDTDRWCCKEILKECNYKGEDECHQ